MRSEVAISEVEPLRSVIGAHRVEALKRVRSNAPTGRLIDEAAQRVSDCLQIGRDMQAEELYVIACIDDDREMLRVDRCAQSFEEFRRPNAACECCDHCLPCAAGWTACGTVQTTGRDRVPSDGSAPW